jgi:uncharacterized protein YcfJ
MKKVVLTCAAIATTLSAPAQLFSPESLSGAFWGSLVGGVVGGDCRDGFSGEGAAIGAGVGLLAGAIAGESRRHHYYDSPSYVYSTAPSVSFGYGYGSCEPSAYVYYAPNSYCAPGYYYRPSRPNYALGGTLLGAASGALIGQGADGKPGEGAAIGAAAGLVLGSVAEHAARRREEETAQPIQANPAQRQTQTQQHEIIETPQPEPSHYANTQITSKPVANSTYYWKARPQIPDAPRVPDAPTF